MDIDVLAIAAVAITVVLFVLLSYLGRKKHLRPSPVCISDRIDTDRFHRNSRSSGNLHSNNHSTVYCSRTSGRDYCTSGSDLKRCRYDVTGAATAAVLVAKSEQLLDREVYDQKKSEDGLSGAAAVGESAR